MRPFFYARLSLTESLFPSGGSIPASSNKVVGHHYIVIFCKAELIHCGFRNGGRNGGRGIQALPGRDKRESF